MKRTLLTLILLLTPSIAFGQAGGRTNSNPLGGSLFTQDAGTCSTPNSFLWQILPNNAGTTTLNLAGTFSGTITVRGSNNGGGTWSTFGTVTAVGTTIYSTNGFTDFCADLTTFTSGVFNVSISTGLQQVVSVVTGGGGSGTTALSVSQNAWYASPNCPGGSTNCSFVNANTHWVCDATTTNTQNVVTAPDGNFLTTAKVGQTVWATASNCNSGNAALAIAETTILSVDSNTQIHTTANATSTNAGTATLVWGTLDTPNAANCGVGTDNIGVATTNAINAGVPLYLPSGGGTITAGGSGGILVECSEFQAPTSTTTPNPFMVIGPAWIVATPNFAIASVPAGNAGLLGTFTAVNNQVPNVTVARDLTFLCGNYNNWGSGSTHPIIFAQRVVLTNVTGWGCGAGTTLSGFNLTGPSTHVALMSYNFGQTACQSTNTGGNQIVVFTGTGYCSGPIGLTLTGVGNVTQSFGTFYQSFGNTAAVNFSANNQTFDSYGDIIECENNNNTICVKNAGGTGGRANLYGTTVYSTTETAAAFGLLYTGASNTTYLNSSVVTGAGGILVTGAGLSGAVIDGGNNVLTGGTICPSSGCTYLQETNSSNGVPVTAAKLVLSATWGSTAAVTAPSGGNAPIGFTITNSGTGQGASPTITYTFPTAYVVAPLSCTATQTGGTNAVGTFTSSSLSTTGVTFTFSLTPTASNTEIVQVTCVTP